MQPRFVLIVALAAAALACKGASSTVANPGAPCTTSAQCGGGLACSNNTCQATDAGSGNGGDGGNGNGGSDGGSDGGCVGLQCQQATCAGGGTTLLSGTVYDPAGNVPLPNALVYVPNGPVQPFTQGVSCDVCGAGVSGNPVVSIKSDTHGNFELSNVPSGANIPLVIQIGKWRRQVTIPQVNACASNQISDKNLTRLPRDHTEGDIPQLAIATGSADRMECLLLKMGISSSEFTAPSSNGRVHFYQENGEQMVPAAPPGSDLWSDAGTLRNYDVVLLPCESSERRKPSSAIQNIVDYTSSGGRVFTTHYGYVWTAFQDPFMSAAQWAPDQQATNPPDPWTVTVTQGDGGTAGADKGTQFAEWLVNVGASATQGSMVIHEGRHNVTGVTGKTKAWMTSTFLNSGTSYTGVPHLTFNTPINAPNFPDGGSNPGCGRVVFSDFHVSTTGAIDAGPGGNTPFPQACILGPLTAQEKALEFMLFDLSSCIQSDTAPTCQAAQQSCSTSNPCCNGLSCLDSVGAACSGNKACLCEPAGLN